jgi:sulfoxide reductase heme-binding subunit YedZ
MRFKRRLVHHGGLIAVSTALLLLFYGLVPGDDPKYLWSMATGYTSLILAGITLSIGPLNVIGKRRNPVSSDLRRDVGIWSGFVGIAHIVIGIQVHMGNIWLYFFKSVEGENAFVFRADLFGAANYTGLIAGLILLVLLVISNDLSLNLLRPSRWKTVQQFSYLFFVLTVAHSFMYQIIEKRMQTLVGVLIILTLIPVILQLKGYFTTSKLK